MSEQMEPSMTYRFDDFERVHDRLDDEIAALSGRAVKAEAEADRLRKALAKVAHEAVDAPHARQIATDALNLDAEDGDR